MATGSAVTVLPGATSVPPLSARVTDLLARSDGEVVAARSSQDPGERFVHAHLAALRAGAALVEQGGGPRRRGAPRTVWDMVAATAPQLSDWAGWFAAAAPRRAAVESGRWVTVDDAEADTHLAAAEQFQDAVRAVLGVDAMPERTGPAGRFDGGPVLRAS